MSDKSQGSPSSAPPLQRPPTPYLLYSPYNDPNQYIIPNAAPGHQRGPFELAFSQIGCSILTGASIGGTMGTVRGLNLVKDIPSFPAKRAQMLNSVVKGATTSANTFGLVALVYSALIVALSKMRGEEDINTYAAATTTGVLTGLMTNKSPVRQKLFMRGGIGGLIGLGMSVIYCNNPYSTKKRY